MGVNPADLPGLHEQQERLETGNILRAGLGDKLGIATRDWGDGLWSVRCASVPTHQPGNQIMGVRKRHLAQLPELLPWFDEVGANAFLRWPGPAIDHASGKALSALGFGVHELEAWLSAPIDALTVDAVDHDIRELTGADDTAAFGEAFVGGWGVTDPEIAEVALAAMAPWPGPSPWRRYTAFVDGTPAGEAVLALFGDVAYLAEAATVPAFRRRGIQRALIARRIADARAAGASTVFGAVQYGDQSWANMRALGLREAFLTLSFRRSPR